MMILVLKLSPAAWYDVRRSSVGWPLHLCDIAWPVFVRLPLQLPFNPDWYLYTNRAGLAGVVAHRKMALRV